ncbi:cupin domain-containing protein [Pedobacter sp. Du54]|uniref:cupin domain-containing protein n=1 Tax=Pedobacter anseongensis TaxID=3133439 RepID=UPI0030A62463
MEGTFEIVNLFDDGTIPNSKYPVIIYHTVFATEGDFAANFLEKRFAQNGWSNSFRWRVYDYHHYHTNTHEVLGVYAGNALLQLGGPEGEKMQVRPGDVIMIPAGTGHISLSHSDDFAVVGAYPRGIEPDLIKLGDQRPDGVRDKVDKVPVPQKDPLFGQEPQGMVSIWTGYREDKK